MTVIPSVTHDFVSAQPAANDATKVDGPKWNAAHIIAQATAGLLGGAAAGATAVMAADEALGVLGFSAYMKTLVDTASRSALQTELGIGGAIIVTDPTYGAVGDNVADDTAAIQAAVTAAAASGRSLYFPAGIYRITAPIIFPDTHIKIYGDGKLASHIHVDFNGRGFSFEDVLTYGLTISGLHFYGNGDGGTVTSIGIYIASAAEETAHILFDDLRFSFLDKGTDGTATYGVFDSVFYKCDFIECQTWGVDSNGSGVGFYNCSFRQCGWGVRVDNEAGNASIGGGGFFSCLWVLNDYDVVIQTPLVRPLGFFNCWMEQCTTLCIGTTEVAEVKFLGLAFYNCLFQPSATATLGGVMSSFSYGGTVTFNSCTVYTDLFASAALPTEADEDGNSYVHRTNCISVNGAGTVTKLANTDVRGPASATDGHFAQFDGITGKLIKGGLALDTDGTLAANSDTKIPSQKAVKTYADALIAANDAMVFKGVIDCSANPNYPAADRGHTYRISVAGKIGGASGTNVEAGDLIVCLTDSTSAGTQAGVGANWTIAQSNLDGAVIGPSSATDNAIARFDATTGKLIQNSAAYIDDSGNVGCGTASPLSRLHVVDEGITSQPRNITVDNYVSAINAGSILLRHARGTKASPTAVLSGDSIGAVAMNGYGATGFTNEHAAILQAWAGQNWSDANHGTYITLQVTPNNSTTIAEKFRLTGDGYVGLGGETAPAAILDVAGGGVRVKGGASTGVVPSSGEGLEYTYDTTGHIGFVISYDRTGGAFKGLKLDGSTLSLNSQSDGGVGVGTASLPTSAKFSVVTSSVGMHVSPESVLSGYVGVWLGAAGMTLMTSNYNMLSNGTDMYFNRPTGGILGFGENNVQQLSIASGGKVTATGNIIAPNLAQTIVLRAVDFSAAGDNPISITLPSGYARYRVGGIVISKASADISAATWGLFTSTGGGGTAIMGAGQAVTVATASENTNNNFQFVAPATVNTQNYNAATIYFRVGATAAAGRTADVTIFFQPVS